MARGTLRIFLGSAPGVGKTYTMLREGHRLRDGGEDVVVAFARDRGRRDTRALLAGLELIPAARVPYRALHLEELDLDAVIRRGPATALVDEYAHTNPPGSRNAHRWQDIDELLDAGINVLSTLDVQNLASLSDVVSTITEDRPAETVPDEIARRAGQIQLVDIAPELLRQRLADGKIVATDRIDAALAGYYRPGNQAALRELALLWLADRVDEGLASYRAGKGIETSWPARERIVVGLPGGQEGEILIRRGARILNRVNSGDLLAVHVRAADRVAAEPPQVLESQRRLVQDLGGSYHVVAGDDPAAALLDFARSVNATQIVIGMPRRGSVSGLLAGLRGTRTGARVVRGGGAIDVHIVSRPAERTGPGVPRRRDLGRVRVATGFVMAVCLPALLELLLAVIPEKSLATTVLVQLTGSVAVALVGGLWPAILAALWSSLLVNYFSTAPVGNLTISDAENALALLVFVGVSAAVAIVVDLSARRSKEAALASAEAATLADLSRGAAGSEDTLVGLLEQALEVFQVRGAALLGRADDDGGRAGDGARAAGGGWQLIASAGDVPALGYGAGGGPGMADILGDNVERIDAATCLVLTGRVLPASDRRLLGAFGVHLMAQLERQQLQASRSEVLKLAEGNTMRTSILRAVSHDLRTPLAGIKLAVGALRQEGVRYTREEEQELLATIEDCSDRLEVLVGNLLDMSRITSDSIKPLLRAVRWYEIIPGGLHGIAPGRVRVELPANMAEVDADEGMLERVIANIVENAVKYAPGSDIVITGSAGGLGAASVNGIPAGDLRIIDHGTGIPADRVVDMFRPFQRLDDATHATGVGLGLAVAKGFTEAMGGRLTAEATPGGGLTMVISLPLSAGAPFQAEPVQAPLQPQSAVVGRHHAPPILSSGTDAV
ncbi:ATP-binding protein [Arthrobacter sp. SO3]|uniref:ATP-binding protein n=1 Tax=Arthrobacter sp. SO3 TaxID=1897057 RepID=UPI001CFF87C5|nr:ATP-binding protein [Arthrobacter sp. SO3]MCB5291843.1 Sensor protein KdpD [Arthrobacter sp. SO3]